MRRHIHTHSAVHLSQFRWIFSSTGVFIFEWGELTYQRKQKGEGEKIEIVFWSTSEITSLIYIPQNMQTIEFGVESVHWNRSHTHTHVHTIAPDSSICNENMVHMAHWTVWVEWCWSSSRCKADSATDEDNEEKQLLNRNIITKINNWWK